MQPPEVLEDSPFKENHCKHGNEQESKFTFLSVDWAKFVKMTGEGELISDFGKKSKKQLKD